MHVNIDWLVQTKDSNNKIDIKHKPSLVIPYPEARALLPAKFELISLPDGKLIG